MRVADLLWEGGHATVRFDSPLISIAATLAGGLNALVVVDQEGRFRGVISILKAASLLAKAELSSKFSSQSISLFIDERPALMHCWYPIEAALQLMAEEERGYLVAVDGLRVVGLLTHRSILGRLLERGVSFKLGLSRLGSTSTATLMTHNSLAEAYRLMLESGYYEIPLVEEEVVGVLSMSDVIGEAVKRGFKELINVKAYGKCRMIERPAGSLREALEVAFTKGVNLLPVSKYGGELAFVKLEEVLFHLVKEVGAFKVAEAMDHEVRQARGAQPSAACKAPAR